MPKARLSQMKVCSRTNETNIKENERTGRCINKDTDSLTTWIKPFTPDSPKIDKTFLNYKLGKIVKQTVKYCSTRFQ